jgi:hypothetical protein
MARHVRAANLETRTSRLKLPVAKKPVFVKVGPGVSLGYRQNLTAGTWVTRVADGRGGNWTKGFASADDFEEANANSLLDSGRLRIVPRPWPEVAVTMKLESQSA